MSRPKLKRKAKTKLTALFVLNVLYLSPCVPSGLFYPYKLDGSVHLLGAFGMFIFHIAQLVNVRR